MHHVKMVANRILFVRVIQVPDLGVFVPFGPVSCHIIDGRLIRISQLPKVAFPENQKLVNWRTQCDERFDFVPPRKIDLLAVPKSCRIREIKGVGKPGGSLHGLFDRALIWGCRLISLNCRKTLSDSVSQRLLTFRV